MKIWAAVALLLIIFLTALVTAKVAGDRRRSEAKALGYDDSFSSSVKGADGARYILKIFWKRVRVIPQTNPVLVRIIDSSKHEHDQVFSTGDRQWISQVTARRNRDGDEIVLEIQNIANRPNFFTNKVTARGLDGYPQLRQKELERNKEADERNFNGRR
jgi:hypothetical protein